MTMPTRCSNSPPSLAPLRRSILVLLLTLLVSTLRHGPATSFVAEAASIRAVAPSVLEEEGPEQPADRLPQLLPAAYVTADFPEEVLDPLDFLEDTTRLEEKDSELLPLYDAADNDLDLLFDYNVTLPDGTLFDEFTTDMHRKLGVSISGVEAINARFIQAERVSRGIQGLGWSADLIVQAQNWARYLARIQQLIHRANLAQGVTGWRVLFENIGENARVTRDGMHQAFMNSPGHRANMLDGRANRIGLGIGHGGNFYWVVQIFKQAV